MGNHQRILTLSTIILTTLATAAHAHAGDRKSLSFRQELPTTKFVTDPPSIPAHISPNGHPHPVARHFIQEHITVDGFEYYIRNDSYTDEHTGISHVYVRQLVDGLEVADGNMNLNIYDGQVLSYGSSIFIGQPSSHALLGAGWSQETYCTDIPQGEDPFVCDISLGRIRSAASKHAASVSTKDRSPIAAAYFFALAVYPNEVLLDMSLDSALASRHECQDSVSTDCWTVSPPPGVLSPVIARLVYVQTHTPEQEGTQLNLAWRLEVEMEDNHYEAYVSAHDPSKIIASVDWVQDGPAPREDGWLSELEANLFGQANLQSEQYPVVEVPDEVAWSQSIDSDSTNASSASSGGSYRVWRWGINDPASGNRTMQVSPYRRTASPLGWHSVPAGKDRIGTHPDMKPDAIVNHRTTVGNNVVAQANWSGRHKWISKKRPIVGSNLIFDFAYGANPWDKGWRMRNPRQYVNASVTQHFYTANMYHDLLYLYGFNEASGNFQQHNFGKGGAEGDAVIVQAQDNKGFNNANFLTVIFHSVA